MKNNTIFIYSTDNEIISNISTEYNLTQLNDDNISEIFLKKIQIQNIYMILLFK